MHTQTAATNDTSRWRGYLLLLALFAVAGVRPAQANTYLFSFTGTELMNALNVATGPAAYGESAYFAIFVQPDPGQVSNYTFVAEKSPNPNGPNPWETNTITDPSSPNLGYSVASPCTANCAWARFDKAPNQTSVTVVSGANGGPGNSNIFLDNDWFSFAAPPYGWGGTDALITSIMPGNAVFSFSIATNANLSGSYSISGYASGLQSGTSSYMTFDTKEDHGIPFTLTATAHSSVPEPGTLGLLLTGGIALAALRRTRKTTRR
jgi:hypothetical protein